MVAAAGSDTIYFGTDKSDVSADAQATLTAQARWMLANPNVRASVEGHADERGTREYNQALGERRAQCGQAVPDGAGRARSAPADDQLGQGTPGRHRARTKAPGRRTAAP